MRENLLFQKNLLQKEKSPGEVFSTIPFGVIVTKNSIVTVISEDHPTLADFIEDVIVENKQALEMINIYNNILSNTMDAYTSIISNNLNIVMKFLTSVTILISLPTIIASFYGMNVGLPLQGHPLAFLIIILICLMVMVLLAFVFVRKRFF